MKLLIVNSHEYNIYIYIKIQMLIKESLLASLRELGKIFDVES